MEGKIHRDAWRLKNMVEIKETEERLVRFTCPRCGAVEDIWISMVRKMTMMPRCSNCLSVTAEEVAVHPEMVTKESFEWFPKGMTAYGYCVEYGHEWEKCTGWPPEHECTRCGAREPRPPVVMGTALKCDVCGVGVIPATASDGVMTGDDGKEKAVLVCPRCRPTYGVRARREREAAAKAVE